MLYTPQNARGATVYDVGTKSRMDWVIEIDTGAGTVRKAVQPFRTNAAGDGVEAEVERYASIYPILAGFPTPCLFHCYGRLP